MRIYIERLTLLLCILSLSACTVLAVADAMVSTTVKVGSAVVGAAIDVTKAGVHAVAGNDSEDDKKNVKK